MKTVSLILLGAILTISIQVIDIENIPFVSNANATGNKEPCKIIKDAYNREINELYRVGYRVKGVGSGSVGIDVVMCKG